MSLRRRGKGFYSNLICMVVITTNILLKVQVLVVIGEPVLLLKISRLLQPKLHSPLSSVLVALMLVIVQWLHALHSHLVLLVGHLLVACTDSSAMMNPGKSFPPIDDDIVKTAMDAAERAMSSMTMNTPVVNSDIEGKHGFLKMIKMSIKKRNVLEFNQNFVDNMTVLSSRL
jgi:hypothetical protein